jgi:5'-nucleotidase
MVIAGINEGANLGPDVFISGTVGAALQAHFRGVPAMAVSVADLGSVHYDTAARVAAALVDKLETRGLPTEYLVNVNVPDLPANEIRGVMVTRQARRRYADLVREERDTRGKAYYWIVRGRAQWDVEQGTDMWAIANGYVSLLPFHGQGQSAAGAVEMADMCQPLMDALRLNAEPGNGSTK